MINNKAAGAVIKMFLDQNSKLPILEEQIIICSSIDYDFDDMNPYPSSIQLTIIDKDGNVSKATYQFLGSNPSL